MSMFWKFIIGLVILIGIGFFISVDQDMITQEKEAVEAFTDRLTPIQYIQNIHTMYSNNKITAAAAISILKDYSNTLADDTPELQRIRIAIGEELPVMTNADRMKLVKDELNGIMTPATTDKSPNTTTTPSTPPIATAPPVINSSTSTNTSTVSPATTNAAPPVVSSAVPPVVAGPTIPEETKEIKEIKETFRSQLIKSKINYV